MAALIIPYAAVSINHAPHPEQARQFIDYLLRPDTERAFAESDAAKMPVRSGLDVPDYVRSLDDIQALRVDYAQLALIVVAHDPLEALARCDRSVVLEGGAVAEIGQLESTHRSPGSRWVAPSYLNRTRSETGTHPPISWRLDVETTMQISEVGYRNPGRGDPTGCCASTRAGTRTVLFSVRAGRKD